MAKYLFRSQVNELIRIILKEELDAGLFTFDRDLSDKNMSVDLPLRIELKDSGFYFFVEYFLGYTVRYFPRQNARQGTKNMHFVAWKELVPIFAGWIGRVKEELSEPSPLLLIKQGSVLTEGIPTDKQATERFNEDELDRLKTQLALVRKFLVSETKPTEEQLNLIDEKLRFLEESARRQTKSDWAHTAIGIAFTIAVGLTLAPDQANRLFGLVSEVIRAIFTKLLP